MTYNVFALIAGSAYCFLMTVICLVAVRRSSFGYLIVFYEYFYILGLGVFPLVASLALINVSPTFINYESTSGGLSNATFVHIVLYGVGSFFGYFGIKPFAIRFSRKVIAVAKFCKFPNSKWFYFSSISSIFFNLLYLNLVGLDVALLNAGLARSGDFSGLIGFEQYSFIKTLAMIGLFSVISLPFFIIRNERLLSSFFLILTLAILLYMQSVARAIFFDTVLLFALLYYSLTKTNSKSAIIVVSVASLFLLYVVIYGKEFVGMFSTFLFLGGDFELVKKYDDFPSYFFSQFGHLVYGVDAGIKNFFEHGPLMPKDILLSPIGFIPSSFYSAFGLDYLSYQLVDESQRLSCINTLYFPDADKCSMPPYITGFSAYIFPMVGGLIFGFLRFFIYSILEVSWIELQKNPELLWIVIAALLVANRLMLFIPNTISFAVFSMLILFTFIMFQKVKLRFI